MKNVILFFAFTGVAGLFGADKDHGFWDKIERQTLSEQAAKNFTSTSRANLAATPNKLPVLPAGYFQDTPKPQPSPVALAAFARKTAQPTPLQAPQQSLT